MIRAILLVIVGILFLPSGEALGQMKRKNIKRNNRSMAAYRGQRFDFKNKVYNSIGISLNSFNYYGDLAPLAKTISTDLSLTKPAIGVSFTHRFGPRYQVTGSFTYGGIQGSDNESADPTDKTAVYRYVRNLSFRNRITEFSAVAVIDLFKNEQTYLRRVPWTPYAYGGIAVFKHNPQAQVPDTNLQGLAFSNAGEWVDLQPLETEGKSYSLIQFALPLGIGARFRLMDVMDIAFEWGMRYTFTDYLDDVSGSYIDLNTFGNNELAKALSYRSNEVPSGVNSRVDEIIANRYTGYSGFTTVAGYGHVPNNGTTNLRGKDGNDAYMVTTLRVTYILGKSFNRAKFR
ncbi:MAG: DUF6089 family protein [Cyclobacteriaceae bacterium]|nr:DUF6089 family protein [Cyclobacteriaceae bacterium]